MARPRPLVPTVLLAALLLAAPRAGAATWIPSAVLDDPGDIVSSELARLNALPTHVQIGAGRVLLSSTDQPDSKALAGTVGVRGPRLWGDLYPSFVGTWGATRAATLDLQINVPRLYPKADLLVPTRDWMFNVQARVWAADVEVPGTDQRKGQLGVTAGAPTLIAGSGNLVFRGLHDAVRVWRSDSKTHVEGNLRGGFLYSTGDLLSLSLDGGVTSMFDDWRWPLQMSAWVALSSWFTVGVGGGFIDLRHVGDNSWGASLAVTF
jgi:hypothetical protein